ncbi:hypothetical protein [Streptomyces sp. KL116D]|uniref:hypothetical protein n=1 Tax=Streptomyces sp. KL116D TaxID=3045152 RepID=UPI0035588C31
MPGVRRRPPAASRRPRGDEYLDRLGVYVEQTEPLLVWYEVRSLLSRVDAVGAVADVTGRTLAALRAAATE